MQIIYICNICILLIYLRIFKYVVASPVTGRWREVDAADQEGRRPMAALSRCFEVQILYREPLHEVWAGQGSRPPFVARYRRIQADDDREAIRIARHRFDDLAKASNVHWNREVVEVRVQPVIG
jgi:hypothetical protein